MPCGVALRSAGTTVSTLYKSQILLPPAPAPLRGSTTPAPLCETLPSAQSPRHPPLSWTPPLQIVLGARNKTPEHQMGHSCSGVCGTVGEDTSPFSLCIRCYQSRIGKLSEVFGGFVKVGLLVSSHGPLSLLGPRMSP